MANTFVTNKLADFVSGRLAASAPYLTVGAKSYFGDQLSGKRNGQSYEFVIKDVGKVVDGLDISGNVSTITERKVTKTIGLKNIAVQTNAIEAITDVRFDEEIAKPNGKALAEGIVQDVIAKDIPACNVAVVGKGWLPLSKASRVLASITSEDKFGFIDPSIESIVDATGKGFKPVSAEPINDRGIIGSSFGTEWRQQQFFPQVSISEALAQELESATVSSYVDAGDGTATLTLSGVTEDIPAGTPIQIEGVFATNLIGNKTSSLKAWIAMEDATAGAVKVKAADLSGQGTKEACDKNGDALTAASLAGLKIRPIEAGDYYMGLIRAQGAFELDTLKKLDWSNAELSTEGVEGISVLSARAVDVLKGTNITRYAVAYMAGIVDSRMAVALYVKDTQPNLISL